MLTNDTDTKGQAMNILVIGGTRFFGIHTVKRLLESGHTVTVATRGGHENPFAQNVRHLTVDKTDADSVRRTLGGQVFDAVIDKVAYASNDVRSLLANIRCTRYIQMSSCAVYQSAHLLITEDEFDARKHPLHWIDRPDDYAEGKRQAERAALEFMQPDACTFVRYPVVLGANDYTNRLRFYTDHIRNGIPMHIEHPAAAVSYIHELEAGAFFAHLAEHPVSGAVNGCAKGILSQQEILEYIAAISQKKAILSDSGDPAPYDGNCADTSYNCTKAEHSGFAFSDVHTWITDLLKAEFSAKTGAP